MKEKEKFEGSEKAQIIPFKEKMRNWTNNKFIPFLGKFGQQRHLSALRDAFGTIIPLIIAGSIAVLLITVGFGGWGSQKISILGLIWMAAKGSSDVKFAAGSGWEKASNIGANMFAPINSATVGAMSLYVAFLVGYFIGVSRNFKQPIMAGFAGLASFIVITMGQFTFFSDAKGLFSAIIAGFIGSELLVMFSRFKKLELKLPAGVPPAVSKSFAVFVPMLFTLVIVAILNTIVWAPINYVGTEKFDVYSSSFASLKKSDLLYIIDKAFKSDSKVDQTSVLFTNLTAMKTGLTTGNIADFEKFINNHKTNGLAETLNWILANNDIKDGVGPINVEASHSANTFAQWNNAASALIIKFEQVNITTCSFGLGAGIYKLVQSPFLGFVSSPGGVGIAILFVFIVGFFWFFGIHGSNVAAAIFEPIWLAILATNSLLVENLGADLAQKEMTAFSKPFFDSYMYIGGSGATLALIISTLIFSKKRELKEVAKFSFAPGIFQINEPAIFGYPIILNPIWIVPFIFAPIANVVVAWLAISIFHIVNAPYIMTPWTAPWFIGALLSTGLDWRAFVLALVCFALSFAFWIPAVWIDNMVANKKNKLENKANVQEEKVKSEVKIE